MIKAQLPSVVLDAAPSPPLPPMCPGEVSHRPPLLEPSYPSVPDTLIDVPRQPRPKEPLSRQPVGEAAIDGRPAHWFQARDDSAHARETLFSPRSARCPWTVHPRIDAANANELSDTLRIVSQLPLE